MDFDDLREELADRGFQDVSLARRGRFINAARAELDGLELWPYREVSETGPTPLAITDLGAIEMVVDAFTGYALKPYKWAQLVEWYGDLSTTGTPLYYYVARPSGVPTLATYPLAPAVTVQHWRVPPDLVQDFDVPIAPTRFHMTIVDIAQRMLLGKNSGDTGQLQTLQAQINDDVEKMRLGLLIDQVQGPDTFVDPVGDDC